MLNVYSLSYLTAVFRQIFFSMNCNFIEIKKYILFIFGHRSNRCVLLLCTDQIPDTQPQPAPQSISQCTRPNCTNDVCRENGLVCCGDCEKLDYALLQVCQCCPQVRINVCIYTSVNFVN